MGVAGRRGEDGVKDRGEAQVSDTLAMLHRFGHGR